MDEWALGSPWGSRRLGITDRPSVPSGGDGLRTPRRRGEQTRGRADLGESDESDIHCRVPKNASLKMSEI